MLIEFDLSGAEWVICAYLSGDKNMLDVAQSGRSPHVATGAFISGAPEEFVEEENKIVGNNTDPDLIRALRTQLKIPPKVFLPRSMSIRQMGKKSNHAFNYFMQYRRFALQNEISEAEAKPIAEGYSTVAYPGIRDYWEDTKNILRNEDRTLTNCFGRKVRLMGEWGIELWMAAYSFRPQSTCFDVCRTGMMAAFNDTSKAFQPAKLCAQVHDSNLFDYMKHDVELIREFCYRMKHEHMRPILTITDPHGITRDFQLGVDCKMGMNWGNMISVPHPEELTQEHFDEIKAKTAAPPVVEAPVLEQPLELPL